MDKKARTYYNKMKEIGKIIKAITLPPAFNRDTQLCNMNIQASLKNTDLAISTAKATIERTFQVMETGDGRPT